MAWDIYGNELRRGYCEVHPHVNQEYPCSLCLVDRRVEDKRRRESERNRQLESICSAEIEALQKKSNENGFRTIITFEKL